MCVFIVVGGQGLGTALLKLSWQAGRPTSNMAHRTASAQYLSARNEAHLRCGGTPHRMHTHLGGVLTMLWVSWVGGIAAEAWKEHAHGERLRPSPHSTLNPKHSMQYSFKL